MRFPKIHIAESVVNRILNAHDGIESARAPATLPPELPDTQQTGEAINAALAQPQPELPAIDDAPDPGATLNGDPLMRTMLKPGR